MLLSLTESLQGADTDLVHHRRVNVSTAKSGGSASLNFNPRGTAMSTACSGRADERASRIEGCANLLRRQIRV